MRSKYAGRIGLTADRDMAHLNRAVYANVHEVKFEKKKR